MGDAPVFYSDHIHYHGYYCGSGGVFDGQGAPFFRLTQGSLPVTWVVTGIPPGLTAPVSPSIFYLLGGTPTVAGTYTISATATNAFGSASLDLILDVGELFLTDATAHPLSVFGELYEVECTSPTIQVNLFLTAIGVTVNWTYQAISGISTWQNLNIQPYAGPCGGLTFTPPSPHAPIIKDYAIDNSGSPSPPTALPTDFTPGHCYTEDIKAFDLYGTTINYSITTCFVPPWHYTPPPTGLDISCDSPPYGVVGVAYTHTILASGGTAPYSFAITGGALPTGLSINSSTGVISGTPTVASTYSFQVTVTDAVSATAAVTCSIVIVAAGALAISCNFPPAGFEGIPYTHTILATGGTPPYTFAITSGALPTGLSINSSTGVISGTPTVAATYSFQVTVTDFVSATAAVTCSILIYAAGVAGNIYRAFYQ